MKLTLILMAIVMIALLFALLVADRSSRKARRVGRYRVRPLSRTERLISPFLAAMRALALRCNSSWDGGNRLALANAIVVNDGCRATRLADGAIARRSFVKVGSDGYHVAACAADTDIPLGHTGESSCAAAEDSISYGVLGLGDCSIEAVTSGAVADGDFLVVAGATTVKKVPVAAGTYYIIGRYHGPALADGKAISFIPCFPTQRVVA